MEPRIKKTINTLEPVKAWKIMQFVSFTAGKPGMWYSGWFMRVPLNIGMWQPSTSGPGFHAFKSRRAATQMLTTLAREGMINWPTVIVQVYLRGKVEFGVYRGYKTIRGSHLLVKEKHIPNLTPQDIRFLEVPTDAA